MAASKGDAEDFESAMAMLDPYLKSGRFKPFDGRTEFVPDVRAEPARELISGVGEQIDFLDEFLDANVGTTGYPGHYVRLIPSIAAGTAGTANYWN